ncbi:MAG: acetoacetyl-CoA reductase [Gammaproteobacteria bacterium]
MTKQIALITGGMGGIGQAICRELHDLGFHVIAAYQRKEEAALAWQKEQQDAGYKIDIVHANVTDYDACAAMAQKVEQEFGPIDVLVNNAGITNDATCCKMTKDNWDIVINTDLNSVFYVTSAFIKGMTQRKYGRIINISSINGQRGQYGQVNYSAAKAGIHGFTKALAREVAKDKITVNTISPGYVATEMVKAVPEAIQQKILAEIPMGRFAEPEEIAHVVGFLVNQKNAYITGANIAVNGGHYML